MSEVYRDAEGRDAVDVVSEEDYYRWMFTSTPPRFEAYPLELVWVE